MLSRLAAEAVDPALMTQSGCRRAIRFALRNFFFDHLVGAAEQMARRSFARGDTKLSYFG
jgi:hypothetical protein